jgi:hypothetical protein
MIGCAHSGTLAHRPRKFNEKLGLARPVVVVFSLDKYAGITDYMTVYFGTKFYNVSPEVP